MSYPIISIISPRTQLSFGIGGLGQLWGDATPFGDRIYLFNASLSRSLGARAITVIIGPLYLQLGWRVE